MSSSLVLIFCAAFWQCKRDTRTASFPERIDLWACGVARARLARPAGLCEACGRGGPGSQADTAGAYVTPPRRDVERQRNGSVKQGGAGRGGDERGGGSDFAGKVVSGARRLND